MKNNTSTGIKASDIGFSKKSVAFFIDKPWIWSYLASAVAFIAIVMVSGVSGTGPLFNAAMTFASFSAIVGIGQMFVITLGPGNVDLSIPAVMTLSATLALKFMDTQNIMIVPGLLTAVSIGLICGVFNFVLILLLKIPPIIATLSSSFIFLSVAIWSNRGLRIKPPELLADFSTSGILQIPNVAVIAILLSALAWVFLERSIVGRWVSAIGQNLRAAQLSGVPINAVQLGVYVNSAIFAAIAGFLLSSFSGGANLNMGTEYLLTSIAVVVVGGSSISGGKSNIPGIWGAALFMFLIISMLNSYGLSGGVQLVLTGLIIVAVVVIASKPGYSV